VLTTIGRNAIWLGCGEAAVKGGLLAAVALLARGAGPAGVGTFSIAFAAALIAVMVLAFGQQEVLIREVARHPDGARSLLAGSEAVLRRAALWLLPAATIGALTVSDPALRLTLLALVPYAAARTATVVAGAAFKGRDRMDLEPRARGIEVAVAVALVAAGAAWAWPVWSAGAAFTAGSGLGLLWLHGRRGELGEPAAAVAPGPLVREGLPFMLLAVAGQLLANQDRFLLELAGVARSDIGQWAAAATLVWAVVALPQLLAVAAYPTLSRAAAAGESRIGYGLATGAGGALAGLAACAVLRAAAEPLVRVGFGAGFEQAAVLLGRLALALPGAFALMMMGAVLAAWREQGRALVVMAGAAGLSVCLNLLWIPRLGVAASAEAAVAVYSVAAAVMAVVLLGSRRRGDSP
jgi:O-antigen/teichoic acid export membrane protein